MRKEYLALLAAGCVAANAASVNYDLLGRKGSKMNSPMVYKNVDYSKVKKKEAQKVGSSLENKALAKTGMADGISAIEGFFDSRYSQYNRPYYLRSFNSKGNLRPCPNVEYMPCFYDTYAYIEASNEVFINTYTRPVVNPPYTSSGAWYNPANQSFHFYITSRGTNTDYFVDFNGLRNDLSDAGVAQIASGGDDVGVYMGANAIPRRLDYNPETVDYVRYSYGDQFDNYSPEYETRDSRTYSLIRKASAYVSNGVEKNHSVVYVGSTQPINPADQRPQVYIGVRNNNFRKTRTYDTPARELDNFIYENRTIEFVPAGNYGLDNSNTGYLNQKAHAANAITVGAVRFNPSAGFNPSNGSFNPNQGSIEIANYSSNVTHDRGSEKPEIYNFSHFVTSDQGRAYHSNTNPDTKYYYYPYYDGTEYAAAYTAGMVSNLLASNQFYRWHPEVVKALLLSTDGRLISNSGDAVTNTVPSYKALTFNYNGTNAYYDVHSRFWNGNIEQLKSRVYNDRNEIWFILPTVGPAWSHLKAAIAWLNHGDDIANLGGQIPQDFDLYVYGSNNADNMYTWDKELGRSLSSYNSFEKVDFTTEYYQYLKFRIVLHSDQATGNRHGEVVLGFNLSRAK